MRDKDFRVCFSSDVSRGEAVSTESVRRKDAYSPHEIARVFGTNDAAVYGWLEQGKLSHFTLPGGHLRVTHGEVLRFAETHGQTCPVQWLEAPTGYRILVIDDDDDMLDILRAFLGEDPRFEVKVLSDGFHAGLHIGTWHPDLIILDMLMPGLSGFEICRRIRENSRTRDIPVLALTSLSTPESRQAVTASGVSDYLAKNFHSETFLDRVRALLGMNVQEIPKK